MSDKDGSARPDGLGGGPSAESLAQMERDAGWGVSSDPAESEPCELPDPISPAAFGLPMLEKLILALIDAHPMEIGASRRARLNHSIEAIAGRKASSAALPQNPNRDARDAEAKEASVLLWMADQYLAAVKHEKLSNRALAEMAGDKFYSTRAPDVREARIEDLRKKFAGSYDRRRKGWKPDGAVDVRANLLFQAREHDYVTESVEAQILRRIQAELSDARVPMRLPD